MLCVILEVLLHDLYVCAMVHTWRSEEGSWGQFLSLHHYIGFRGHIWVFRFVQRTRLPSEPSLWPQIYSSSYLASLLSTAEMSQAQLDAAVPKRRLRLQRASFYPPPTWGTSPLRILGCEVQACLFAVSSTEWPDLLLPHVP